MVPVVSCLLQAVENLLQSQDMLSHVGHLVAGRVLHVEDFILPHYTVEVGTLDVNLVEGELESICHGDEDM